MWAGLAQTLCAIDLSRVCLAKGSPNPPDSAFRVLLATLSSVNPLVLTASPLHSTHLCCPFDRLISGARSPPLPLQLCQAQANSVLGTTGVLSALQGALSISQSGQIFGQSSQESPLPLPPLFPKLSGSCWEASRVAQEALRSQRAPSRDPQVFIDMGKWAGLGIFLSKIHARCAPDPPRSLLRPGCSCSTQRSPAPPRHLQRQRLGACLDSVSWPKKAGGACRVSCQVGSIHPLPPQPVPAASRTEGHALHHVPPAHRLLAGLWGAA